VENMTLSHWIQMLLVGALLTGCSRSPALTSQQKLNRATNELNAALTTEQRFYALGTAAKESFTLGNGEAAHKYANELLQILPQFSNNWNYGNAFQDANLVLGRLALKEGQVEKAKQFLLTADRAPGSPQLNTFGPNMSLAGDLLAKGERRVVIEYFALCSSFWKMDNGRLAKWTQDVNAGRTPDFGANLSY
jgi:tetratricopeptide (TPR) repeat protein